jgi:hypothetical protein
MKTTEDGVILFDQEEAVMFLPHWLLEQIIKNAYNVQLGNVALPVTFH